MRISEPSLGDIIRRQRELSAMSLRQFAELAGISNPYLSQIERGLREPSEKVVEAIARTLDVSADALYEQAGLGEDDERPASATVEAIREDPALTARQRQALVDVYEAFTAGRPGARRRRARAVG